MENIEELLEKIRKECPLIPHTNAGQLMSTVRRMKREKELDIPIPYRTGSAISVEHATPANELAAQQWEDFYEGLCRELQQYYRNLSAKLFGPNNATAAAEP